MARSLRVPPNAALAEMLHADQQAGIDPLDQGPPAPPGPPVKNEPLLGVVIPPAGWREEEEERARQRRDVDVDPGPPPPESLSARPAKKRKRAPGTPNLDTVKGWRSEP